MERIATKHSLMKALTEEKMAHGTMPTYKVEGSCEKIWRQKFNYRRKRQQTGIRRNADMLQMFDRVLNALCELICQLFGGCNLLHHILVEGLDGNNSVY